MACSFYIKRLTPDAPTRHLPWWVWVKTEEFGEIQVWGFNTYTDARNYYLDWTSRLTPNLQKAIEETLPGIIREHNLGLPASSRTSETVR